MLVLSLAAFRVNGQTLEPSAFAGVSQGEGDSGSSPLTGKSAVTPLDLAWWIANRDETATASDPTSESLGDRAPDTEGSTSRASSAVILIRKRPDFNQEIYYRNKLETSVESGYLPVNIPFVFDFVVSSPYTEWPLKYTLVPNLFSLRWHVDGIWGRSVFRGNTDFSFGGSYTAIPRGAETRCGSFIFGIRRNFVQPRWRVVPYFEGRGGIGNIDARGPMGVEYAQGQDLTFTLMMGSGARYNLNPRYSLSGGVGYVHISNLYLSEPAHENFGINVYGPMVGFNMRLGRARPGIVR